MSLQRCNKIRAPPCSFSDDFARVHAKPIQFLEGQVFGCYDDNGNIGEVRSLLDSPEQIETIHVRHHEIQNHHRWSSCLELFETASPVGGLPNTPAFANQHPTEKFPRCRIVIDNEHIVSIVARNSVQRFDQLYEDQLA